MKKTLIICLVFLILAIETNTRSLKQTKVKDQRNLQKITSGKHTYFTNWIDRTCFGVMWLVIGAIMAFVGLRFFGKLIFLFGFMFGFTFMSHVEEIVFKICEYSSGKTFNDDVYLKWQMIWIVVKLISGGILSVTCCFTKRLWPQYIGFWLSFMVSSVLMGLITGLFYYSGPIWWSILAFVVCIMGSVYGWYLSRKCIDFFVIMTSCFYGGMAIAHGVLVLWGAMDLGHYPSFKSLSVFQ